jgi:hypothetical protein
MTKRQFEEMFREEILPHLAAQERQRGSGFADKPARREAWNNTVDAYIRDRQLPESAGNWGHPRWLETASRPSRHDHAVRAKKSSAQIDREIAEALNGSRRSSHATASTSASDWAAGDHARKKKKIAPQEARRLLESDGIDFGKDFFQLGSYDVGRIAEVAKLAGYKKRKDAPGSTARMYFQYLSRQRSHATRGMLTVYDLVEVNKQTKKERALHEHFSTRADAKEAQDEYEGYKRPGVTYRIKSRQVPRPPVRWNRED